MPSRAEAVQRHRLLQEYDTLETAVEESASDQLWRLADWLVDNIENRPGTRNDLARRGAGLTIADLAERGRLGEPYLRKLRRVAATTRPDRMPDVTPNVYIDVLGQHDGDLDAANHALRERGTTRRAHRIPESVEATAEQVRRMAPEDQARIVGNVLSDPVARRAVRQDHEASQGILGTSVEITEERRPPGWERRTPVGHLGWTPRRWMADALFLLWRLQNRLVDDQPPSDEFRTELVGMVGEARRHLDRVEAMVQGDTVLDEELAAAMTRWEAEFNE